MNSGLSVSRVGGAAQTKAMKAVVKGLKADLAQYRELAAFAQFGSDLDKQTQQQLRRGERITEIMKQPQYQPLSLVQEVIIIFAASNGYVDDVPAARVRDFERDLYRFMETQHKPLADKIAKEKKFDEEIEKQARAMIEEFKKTVSYDEAKAAVAAPTKSDGKKPDETKPEAAETEAKPEEKKPAAAKA